MGEKDGWPDTKAGAIARRWTEAFSKGEKAMRECLAEIVSPTDLARRSIDQRIEKYRDLHDRLGSLMLVKVDSSSVGRVVATLAASDFAKREFIFNVQTEPPYKLASVMIRETIRQGGHGGFHH